MTVEELIDYLQKLPKETVIGVVFRQCSDYTILEEHDMDYYPAEGVPKGRFDRIDGKYVVRPLRYVLRNGKIMEHDPKTWPPGEVPHFVPVLALPGH